FPTTKPKGRRRESLMKKIASLLAAVMLLTATLAGCGNSGSGSSTTDTSSASSTARQSSAAEDSSAAEGETSSEASATEAGDYGEFPTIEEGKLIMSTTAQFPPYEMVADGEGFNGTGFEGIDVEIASAIADKLGLSSRLTTWTLTPPWWLCRTMPPMWSWPACPTLRSGTRCWTSPTATPPACRWSS